ncbi:histidine phosphatase family protein [Bacteroides nordii]|uniref:histidine phosphatase family protein n=1 Tax=Bacteroides nordii TaxID=291645 RepID=UPI00203AC811|nr:histidine phosphatase family protein [Bacteroides nordii]GFZ41223.1 multiple inositol polyphosphate histidine phosphatase 1 [Bacteroides nordii]
MKGLLLIGIFMFCPVSILWGQGRIQQYAGTAMPYPIVKDSSVFFQDDMVPFYINHLGRHGARFPTSGKALNRVMEILESAQRENRLKSRGLTLLSIIQNLLGTFDGQWGKLSVVGEEEQQGIARRMIEHYPQLFSDSAKVQAIATYVPRCIHSMDAFLACMVEFNSSLHIQRNEGRQYNGILRFFDLNQSYVDYKENGDWRPIYETFVRQKISPVSVMKNFFLESGQETDKEAEEFVMTLFSIAAILPDTGATTSLDGLFTIDEWHNYWQTQNLRQYMSKSSSPVGQMLPVAIAWPLLSEFIHSVDEVIKGKSDIRANFRFAHAETVIPFVALMGIEGTDVQVSVPDSVSKYWKDYEIAPMAANVQWIFYHDKAREIWVKILLNEKEMTLPVSTSRFPYYRWEIVCMYLKKRIAMAKRILESFSNDYK